jgi:myo-inositol-1(or 4)-monophosphatase
MRSSAAWVSYATVTYATVGSERTRCRAGSLSGRPAPGREPLRPASTVRRDRRHPRSREAAVYPSPTAPVLAAPDRAVVAAARGRLGRLCDELRHELVAQAGRVAVELKHDGTPVTSVDREVNHRVVSTIREAFPDHAVVSEEVETIHHGRARWTWVVDPIDGTSNFIAGLPYWCISLALTLEGAPVLAMVEAPPLETRYEAVRGEGAARDGRPIRVRGPVAWDDGRNRHVPLMLSTATARRVRPAVRLNPRVMGSAALDLCQVADGTGAAAVSLSPKVWDVAAGVLLVEEAGGTYLTLDGSPVFPLEPGTEYARRAVAAAAGPDETYLRGLVDALLRDPGA